MQQQPTSTGQMGLGCPTRAFPILTWERDRAAMFVLSRCGVGKRSKFLDRLWFKKLDYLH